MTAVLEGLIDKQDTFEIVRDQIALILATETANQQALAIAASKDPDLWKLRVFTERTNPWEQFLNGHADSDAPIDKSPIVNVWVDNMRFPKDQGNAVKRQKSETVFNVDCYGYGQSSEDGTGHKPGDREAAFEVQRAVRLVRNILMSAQNTYLQLQGKVWTRWPNSISIFQPASNDRPIQRIVGARIDFAVGFSEFSPQFTGENLEIISVDINRAEDGEILVEADYDYT